MVKKIEEKYKELSEVDHVRLRPNMYIGSTKEETQSRFIYDYKDMVMKMKEISVVPGMLKIVDEIVSNSCDEFRRSDNMGLTTINVCVSKNGLIEINDNGGIPVVKHKEAGVWLPEFIFGRLRTSSNYDDTEDRNVVGTNGVGSALTRIFSKVFSIRTADGKNSWIGAWEEDSEECKNITVQKTKKSDHGTYTSFTINYELFDVPYKEMTIDFADMILTRCINAAAANPGLVVTYDDWRIDEPIEFKFKDFKEYIELYRDYVTLKDIIEYKDDDKKVYVVPDGYINIGFVNGAECNNGTHIKALHSLINNPIVEVLNKKNKIELTPRNVDGNYSMFCDVKVSNPSYDSQTKETLTTTVDRFYKDDTKTFNVSDKFIKEICKSDILENVMDWYRKKQATEDQRAIRKINREINQGLKRPDKYITCTSKKKSERQLWIFEGDSAKAAFRTCRNPQTQAGYIMRGVPKSSFGATPSEIMKNEVYNDLVKILGLKFGSDFNVSDVKFDKIVISSDMDVDGHHIAGLLLQFTNTWPELFDKGIVVRSISPIIIAHKGKQIKNFYSLEQYKSEASKLKGWTYKYTKGLGGLNNQESKEMYLNPKFQQFTKDELAESMFKKWFNKEDSNTRKEMLSE